MDYLQDPETIYARSFAIIEREVDLSVFGEDIAPVASRMIHACGMTDLGDSLRYDPRIVSSVRMALAASAPVLVDVEMVRVALSRQYLSPLSPVLCMLRDVRTATLAREKGMTRSSAAVFFWRDFLAGSVVVIGNAPTALFALLKMMDETGLRPAAIIATPVGFVGAVESKQLLADNAHGVPFLTLLGRRGGAGIAAAALNAMAGSQE